MASANQRLLGPDPVYRLAFLDQQLAAPDELRFYGSLSKNRPGFGNELSPAVLPAPPDSLKDVHGLHQEQT